MQCGCLTNAWSYETNVAEKPKAVTTQSLAIGAPVSKSWAFQNNFTRYRLRHLSKKNESRLQCACLTKVILYWCYYYFNCYKLPGFTPCYVVSTEMLCLLIFWKNEEYIQKCGRPMQMRNPNWSKLLAYYVIWVQVSSIWVQVLILVRRGLLLCMAKTCPFFSPKMNIGHK